jgi:hypothetical protein
MPCRTGHLDRRQPAPGAPSCVVGLGLVPPDFGLRERQPTGEARQASTRGSSQTRSCRVTSRGVRRSGQARLTRGRGGTGCSRSARRAAARRARRAPPAAPRTRVTARMPPRSPAGGRRRRRLRRPRSAPAARARRALDVRPVVERAARGAVPPAVGLAMRRDAPRARCAPPPAAPGRRGGRDSIMKQAVFFATNVVARAMR